MYCSHLIVSLQANSEIAKMKRLPYIVILLLVLCGCNQAVREKLSRAEWLLEDYPDSAYTILDSLSDEADDLTKSLRMRFQLLYAQAKNKTDRTLAGKDSVLKEVVSFYDWWGNDNERMTANYMLGCVYRDEGNAPMALKYYRSAIEQADTTAHDCDIRTLSHIYGQTAVLFHLQRSPRLEIEARKKATYYAWKCKDTIAALIFYENMFLPYYMLNQMDSALYYSKKAAAQYKVIGRNELAARTLGLDINVYLRQNNYMRVKQAMDEYERNSLFFDQDGLIAKGRENYYNYKGLYYEGIHHLDSAEFFYRKLLQSRSDINAKEAAYKGLLSLYRQLNISDSIAKYSDLYCQMNDSASFAHSADEITRMQALYNYDESQRRAARQEEMTRTYKFTVIALLVCFLVVGHFVFRFIKRQRFLKKQELIKANTEYSALLIQYNKIEHDLKLSNQDQIKFQEEKETEIAELQRKLSLYQDAPRMINDWNIEQAMLNSPIIRELHGQASRVIVPSKLQWKNFREYAAEELPDFVAKLNKKEIALTDQEMIICLLIRLQFSQGEQSALMGVSKQRINNLKRSINKKLFGKEGAASLNKDIMDL